MDNELIQVKCDINHDLIDIEKVVDMLPSLKTRITQAEVVDSQLQLKLLIAAQTPDEINQWLEAYEERTKTTYSVRSTEKCTGRYVNFKQRRYCQHNTRCNRVSGQSAKGGTKNTNCPSKMIITLKAIKSRHRYKKKNSPDPEFPCEVEAVVTHNHDVDTPDDLKFRPVCDEVRQQLIDLYQIGHTPATALEIIKMNIRLKCDDFEKLLADRKYCPDYQYCYYVYTVFKQEYEQLDFTGKLKEVLVKMLSDFNMKTKERSAEIIFEDNNHIMCVCPPMMKRVHEHIALSSQMVLLDTCKTIDGSKIFILLTPSDCGGLPLGVIITSSESSDALSKGLHLLRYMVGDVIFNANLEGPEIFLTSDNPAERVAIKSVWPKSRTLLCSFDVLQTVWKWLIKPKNNIPQELQHYFFQEFKTILYATTSVECSELFAAVKERAEAYPAYCKFLEDLWGRRESWAFCFRYNFLSENRLDNSSEVAMKFQKEKIFHGVKSFNLIQMLHFITSKFLDYYEVRLLNVAQNQLHKNVLDKPIVPPPEGLVEKIQCLSDNMALVPSNDEDLFYIVNTDVLMCTCFTANNNRLCKHLDWTCCLIYSQKFSAATDNMVTRTIYYKIATGENPEWLLPLNNLESDGSAITLIYIPDANVPIETKFESESADITCSPDISGCPGYKASNPDETKTFESIDRCKQLMEEFVQMVTPFCEDSPHLMLPALERMREQASSLKSATQVASACSSFGHDNELCEDAIDDNESEETFSEDKMCLDVDQDARVENMAENQDGNAFPFYKVCNNADEGPKKTIFRTNKKCYVLSKEIMHRLLKQNPET